MNIKDWKEELQDYCKEYGIKTPLLIPRYKMQGIIEEGFTKNLEPDKDSMVKILKGLKE